MNQSVRPVISHHFNRFEHLFKMKGLLQSGHIDAFVKVILLFPIQYRSNITGVVNRTSVTFRNETRRHMILLQIDDLRTLTFHQQSLFL